MNMEKERRRLVLALALFSVLSVAGFLLMGSVDDSDADTGQVSYGSATLPYGGVSVSWDALKGGAYYYVIEKGTISITFQGHDGKGLETKLAGSGLIVNFRTSEIYGVLEKTTEITIEGKTVTLVLVPGVGYDLPIYGGVKDGETSPSKITVYLNQYFSQAVSLNYKYGSGGSSDNLPPGVSVSYTKSSTNATVSGTPTKIGTYDSTLTFQNVAVSYGDISCKLTIEVLPAYTVTYNANGGSCSASSAVWKDGGNSLTLPAATKTDYNFLGWFTQASGGTYVGTTNDSYVPVRDTTLYAHWEQKNEPVTSISITGSSSVKVGDTTVLTAVSNPSTASDRRVNWTISSGSSYVSLSGTTDTTSGGTVTIKGNAVGTAVIKATARDGSGVTKTFTITVKNDVVYNSFTLAYNANGGSGAPTSSSDSSTKSYYDTTVSTVKPTKSGYDFKGWSTDPYSTSPDYQPGATIRLYPGTTYLYAVWEARTTYWYLNYDAREGSGAPSNQSTLVSSGATSATFTISSTKPVRDGYDFLGWSKTSGATTASFQPGGSITVSSSSTTLYAVWSQTVTEYTFNLVFDTDGGTGGPGKISFVSEERSYPTEIPSDTPAKVGYDFRGWGESAGTDTIRYKPGDTITLSPGTKTLYAVWKQTSYVLILDTNGGKEASRTLTGYGQLGGYTFTIPADFIPTKDGFTFAGWSTSISGKVEISPGETYACESGTLYAVWTKNAAEITYTLRYDANGGTGAPESQSVTVDEGQIAKVTLRSEVPTRDGYDFLGWSDTIDSSQPLYANGEADVVLKSTTTTLYAVWSMRPVTYTLTYNGNASDATNVPEPVFKDGYATCTFIVSSQIPVRDGYVFVGWSKDMKAVSVAEYTGGSTIQTSSRNTIIYAVWVMEQKFWILSFDANGGTGGPSEITETSSGSVHTFTLPTDEPVWEDHVFLGWSTSKTATQASIEKGGQFTTTSDQSKLYAVWKETPKDSFTLTFNLMGGSNGPSTIGPLYGRGGEYSTIIPGDEPISSSGLFQGWATEAGGEAVYQPGDVIILKPGTTTLIAVWSDEPIVTFTLAFDPNEGKGGPASLSGESRDAYKFSIPTDIPVRDGYRFAGWAVEKGGDAAYQPGDSFTPSLQETTLYAVWQGATEYRLSFNIQGGQAGPSDLVENGEPNGHEFTIPDNAVAQRDGYTFKGWATYENGPAELQPGSKLKVDNPGTTYLYAVWEKIIVERTFSLVFDANGGSNVPVVESVKTTEESVKFRIPADTPERKGFTFAGWSDSKDGSPNYTAGADVYVTTKNSVDGVRTLYAVWVEGEDSKVFTLVLDPNGGKDCPSVNPESSSSGSVVFTLPREIPVRDGFVFKGWSEDPIKSATYQPGDSVTVYYGEDGSFTLYAVWEKDGDLKAIPNVKVDGATITFDASDSEGYTKVLWTFGDGTSSWDVAGKHTYSEPGTYVVQLSVYDAADKIKSDTVTVIVEEQQQSSDTSGMIRTIAAIVVSVLVLFLAVRFLGLI